MKLSKLIKSIQTGTDVCIMNADTGAIKFNGCANDLYKMLKKNEFIDCKVVCIRAAFVPSKDSVIQEIYIRNSNK